MLTLPKISTILVKVIYFLRMTKTKQFFTANAGMMMSMCGENLRASAMFCRK